MNIAIYARVSSESQAKDGTIQSQLEALREYAKAHDLIIVHECTDDGYSGSDLNRPGLDQLRDLAREGFFEGVLVLAPDRLSRVYTQQAILLDEFKKFNIEVIFTNRQFGDSPEDNLMLQMQGVIAEYERTKILDRTRRGTIHAIKQGQVKSGNVPYGYRYVRKTETTLAHWEIDPLEVETVRLIFDLYTKQGMKAPSITKHLEAEGIPSRSKYGKWWTSAIYSILHNEAYTGMAYMFKTKSAVPPKHPKVDKYRKNKKSSSVARPKEDWIGIPVPQIIEREQWEAAQRLLKQNAVKSPRNNTKNKYLLRGLVVCGLCGSMAPGYVSNKKTYYSCGAKRNKNLTTKTHEERVAVSHPDFDQKVWTGLTELLSDPQNLQEQIESRLEAVRQTSTDTTEIDKLERAILKLATQERRIIDAYREGVIDLEELREQKERISEKLKSLKAQKKAAQSQQKDSEQLEITPEVLGDVSARFQRVIANADFETRTKLANLLINSVTLYPDRAIVAGNIPVTKTDALVPRHYAAPLRSKRGLKPGSLGMIVRSFKSAVTREINMQRGTPGVAVWQRNYYEHVIRDEGDLERIREYIVNNPLCWEKDQDNPESLKKRL
jgi:site-specific DNA recombinase